MIVLLHYELVYVIIINCQWNIYNNIFFNKTLKFYFDVWVQNLHTRAQGLNIIHELINWWMY